MNETQRLEETTRWRKLKHEIANDFAVISMGLHCLSGIRDDPAHFAEIIEMMSKNLESLKVHIDRLVDTHPGQAKTPPHVTS